MQLTLCSTLYVAYGVILRCRYCCSCRCKTTSLRPRCARFAWGVLAYFIAVILWGTLVRATGSGAGCGDHWPLCNGTVMQHSPSVDTMIEFTHRLTSGLSFFSCRGTDGVDVQRRRCADTWRGRRRLASVAFTLVEAVLGALLVKLGLTAQSQSPLRAGLPGAAFDEHAAAAGRADADGAHAEPANGFSARAAFEWLRLLARCVRGGGDDCGRDRLAGRAGRHAVSGQFAWARRWRRISRPGSGWLVRWRWTHPTVAFRGKHFSDLDAGAGGTAAHSAIHWDNRGLSALVLVLLAAQYVLGVLDVFLLAPLWLQMAHLLGADVLWVALVVLTARLTLVPKNRNRE